MSNYAPRHTPHHPSRTTRSRRGDNRGYQARGAGRATREVRGGQARGEYRRPPLEPAAASWETSPRPRSKFTRPLLVLGACGLILGSGGAVAAVAFTGNAKTQVNTAAVAAVGESAPLSAAELENDEATIRELAAVKKDLTSAKSAAVAKVEAARAEAAQQAARDKERKAILANAQQNPKAVAQLLLPEFGFGNDQWQCLETLWHGESNWRWSAANPSSGAYGIPQSLPASKMASAGADWQTNPATQIKWGLAYIKAHYGTPCGALGAWQSRSPHWY